MQKTSGKLPLRKRKAIAKGGADPSATASTSTASVKKIVSFASVFSNCYKSDARTTTQGGGDVESQPFQSTRGAFV